MIDKQYIESAKIIRKEFLRLTNSLDGYQDDVRKLALFLQNKAKEIQNHIDETGKIKNREDVQKVVEKLLGEIESIEIEENKLKNKVSVINESIEKLKKDEESLYNKIKERYPKLSDDILIKHIQSNL